MDFETLNSGKNLSRKWVLAGITGVALVLVAVGSYVSYAKYQTTKSMTIASGTINYTMPDFEMIAMYQQKEKQTCTTDSCYDAITKMPTSGYNINESKSYCNVNNAKDTGAELYTNSAGEHVISGLQKGSKCYVYFDNAAGDAGDTILGDITVKDSATSFTGVATTNEGVFKAKDDDGDTYYWRGAVTNNYVKFANKFWRIIRINGDGTIRLIYQGASATSTGTDAQIGTSAFNSSYNNNMYIGFKYTSNQVHGTGTESTILGQLNTWYTSDLTSYDDKIDTNAGFCGDRTSYKNNTGTVSGGGTGTAGTYYGANIRLITNKVPILTCPTEDFYTVTSTSKGNKSLEYPIGLITAEEVSIAGGVYGTANQSYYLYNSQLYWTLSPYDFSGSYASVFQVGSIGNLTGASVNSIYGVRPVINLKADVELTGTGTMSDPYVVVGGN